MRLAVTQEPRQEILAVILGKLGDKRHHRARNGQLVFQIEYGRVEKRWSGMKRRRQRSRLQRRRAPTGKDERDLVVPADLLFHPEAAIELDEIGAAAQQDMLAVVHNFRGAGQFIRGCAPTQVGAPLEQFNLISRLSQRASRGQTCESSANNGDGRTLVGSLGSQGARRCPEALAQNGQLAVLPYGADLAVENVVVAGDDLL